MNECSDAKHILHTYILDWVFGLAAGSSLCNHRAFVFLSEAKVCLGRVSLSLSLSLSGRETMRPEGRTSGQVVPTQRAALVRFISLLLLFNNKLPSRLARERICLKLVVLYFIHAHTSLDLKQSLSQTKIFPFSKMTSLHCITIAELPFDWSKTIKPWL